MSSDRRLSRSLSCIYRGAAEPQTLSIRSLIGRELQQVAVEHGRTLAPLADEIKLFESWLDSLGLAVVVMRLADSLGRDPFGSGKIRFGKFVRADESLRA